MPTTAARRRTRSRTPARRRGGCAPDPGDEGIDVHGLHQPIIAAANHARASPTLRACAGTGEINSGADPDIRPHRLMRARTAPASCAATSRAVVAAPGVGAGAARSSVARARTAGAAILLRWDGRVLDRSYLDSAAMYQRRRVRHATQPGSATRHRLQRLRSRRHRPQRPRQKAKWLVLADGSPGLTDFQLAVAGPPRSAWMRLLAREDLQPPAHLLHLLPGTPDPDRTPPAEAPLVAARRMVRDRQDRYTVSSPQAAALGRQRRTRAEAVRPGFGMGDSGFLKAQNCSPRIPIPNLEFHDPRPAKPCSSTGASRGIAGNHRPAARRARQGPTSRSRPSPRCRTRSCPAPSTAPPPRSSGRRLAPLALKCDIREGRGARRGRGHGGRVRRHRHPGQQRQRDLVASPRWTRR